MEIYQQWNEQIMSIGQRHLNLAGGKVIKGNVWRHLNLRSCLTPKQAFECAFDQRRRINIRCSPASIFCWRCIGRTEKVTAINDRGTLCVLHRKNRKRGNYQLTANIVLCVKSFEAVAVFARQSMTLLSGNIQSGNIRLFNCNESFSMSLLQSQMCVIGPYQAISVTQI